MCSIKAVRKMDFNVSHVSMYMILKSLSYYKIAKTRFENFNLSHVSMDMILKTLSCYKIAKQVLKTLIVTR